MKGDQIFQIGKEISEKMNSKLILEKLGHAI